MNIIKPKKLNIGDTIAIIAPSGVVDKNSVLNSKKYFENKGYKVVLGKYLFNQDRYMAGSDEERLEDLRNAFSDNSVDAIICARGGYGALRLVDKIDYQLIENNPKIFCGYSDITILNTMMLKKSGLITFSGPMAQSDFSKDKISDYTQNCFCNTLDGNLSQIEPQNPKIYKNGIAEGILLGGNLSTLTSLCGTDFIPDEKFILMAEDLNEPVYKIDRYFHQLLNINQFKTNLSAILLGEFLDIDSENDFDLLFKELANNLNIPVISSYPISHSKIKCTIPIGAKVILKDNKLKFGEYVY